jgi:isocitrate dehydrogenase
MMLDHIGWQEAADLIRDGVAAAIKDGVVTYDLARQIEGAQEVKCSVFGEAIVERLK